MPDPVTTVSTAVASSVISSVLQNVSTRALDAVDFSGGLDSIKFKLGAAQSYLNNVKLLEKYKVREIERVAYCADEAIEKILWFEQHSNRQSGCLSLLSRFCHYINYLITVCQINGEFKNLRNLIPGIFESNSVQRCSTVIQSEDQLSQDPRGNIEYNEEIVGFDNLIPEILKDLEENSSNDQKLAVVSIWGMGGSGKSTLAKQVLKRADENHFPIKIWMTVSQKYDVLNLRKNILKNIIKIDDETLRKMTNEQVCDKIYESLAQRRYLIVLDDIWEIKSWDDIYFFKRESHDNSNPPISMFPDINNASRIIVTTRKHPVTKPSNIKAFEHKMKPLDYKQSWKLLKGKAFPSHVSVSEPLRTNLETLGPGIIKQCKGLPLALVVLGGYLSKHHDYETWENMAKNVDWKEAGDQIQISKILGLSYDDLPNELKPIFLYITAFPEDCMIKSSDLIKLWIAEGFIRPPRRNYKLEITARSYLDQLYQRGLVQVVKWNRVHKRISKIIIHDVLRDWGIERAEENGFFKVISNSDNAIPFEDRHILCRVALHGYWDEYLGTSMPHLRTLLAFTMPKLSFRGSNSLRAISFTRSLTTGLRVVDTNFFHHIMFLRHICFRYVDLDLPSSIGQLYNLQTLACRICNIHSVPNSVWKISTLRHVHLNAVRRGWCGPNKGQGKNLQTLVITSPDDTDPQHSGCNDMVESIEEMKELVHLHLNFHTSLPSNILDKIRVLGSLEVLKLNKMEGLKRISGGTFPLSLVKIVLRCDLLEEDPMPIFRELPKLVVLDLYHNLHLKIMHCSAGGFWLLEYLKIDYFQELEVWKVDEGALPSLSHVRLQSCYRISLPEQLMDHKQLQLLELVALSRLSSSDYERLKERKFKVIVARNLMDSRLSDF